MVVRSLPTTMRAQGQSRPGCALLTSETIYRLCCTIHRPIVVALEHSEVLVVCQQRERVKAWEQIVVWAYNLEAEFTAQRHNETFPVIPLLRRLFRKQKANVEFLDFDVLEWQR